MDATRYNTVACDDVRQELARVSASEAALTSQQQQNHAADTAMLTVGLVLFWPALLLMPATTDRSAQLAQARGEKEALELAVTRRCSERTTAGTQGSQTVVAPFPAVIATQPPSAAAIY